jgi:hypothetical protein
MAAADVAAHAAKFLAVNPATASPGPQVAEQSPMISKVRNPYFLVPFVFGGIALPVAIAISKALTQALQPAFVIEFILFFGLGVSGWVVLLKRKDFETFFCSPFGPCRRNRAVFGDAGVFA